MEKKVGCLLGSNVIYFMYKEYILLEAYMLYVGVASFLSLLGYNMKGIYLVYPLVVFAVTRIFVGAINTVIKFT